MGALELRPAIGAHPSKSKIVEAANLVRLTNLALDEKRSLQGVLGGNDDLAAIDDILRVGTSAGGARTKAILAWNPNTGEFRHGQTDARVGFEHWLMKLDGVENNRDKDRPDPQGYGLIEYAYFLMAKDAGIEMMPCRLHEEGGQHCVCSAAIVFKTVKEIMRIFLLAAMIKRESFETGETDDVGMANVHRRHTSAVKECGSDLDGLVMVENHPGVRNVDCRNCAFGRQFP